MQKKVNLKINIVFSFISQLVCYLSPLIVSPYISRVLLPEGVGIYSHAYSYVYYFSAALAFGFSSYGISKVASLRNDKARYSECFWSIMFCRCLFAVVSISLYVTLLLTTGFGGINTRIGLALLLVLFGDTINNLFLFQGLEHFNLISYGHVLINVLYLVLVFCFVKSSDDILLFTIIKSSINIVLYIVLWFISIKYLNRPVFSKKEILNTTKGSAVFFLPSVLMSIGGQIDQSVIGTFVSESDVGYYQQAVKFPSLVSNMTYGIAPVMLSRISYLYHEERYDEIKQKISKSLILALTISLPCCIGLYSIGRYFIPLYFGEAFTPSIELLYILLPTTLFSPVSSILINSYFYPTGQTKKMTLFLVAAVGSNLLMTLVSVLTMNMGASGAALGSIISEMVLCSFLIIFARKSIDFKIIGKDVWKVMLGSLFIGLGTFTFDYFVQLDALFIVLIDVLIGIVVYGLTLLLTKEYVFSLVLDNLKLKLKRKPKVE